MKGEFEQDCTETLIERLKSKCPNLSDEALELLSSGMVERIAHNKLKTEQQKKNELWQMMKSAI